MKVIALNTYKKLGVLDQELGRTPEEGEVLEITKERFDVLSGNNLYKVAFVKEYVEEIETATVKVKAEKAVKKVTKKTK